MDAKEYFNNELPRKLEADPDGLSSIGGVFVMLIDGDGGGEWTIDVKSNPPSVNEGAKDESDCTIRMTNEDFIKVRENPKAAMSLFMAGQIKVQGNQMLAMHLQKLL